MCKKCYFLVLCSRLDHIADVLLAAFIYDAFAVDLDSLHDFYSWQHGRLTCIAINQSQPNKTKFTRFFVGVRRA